MKITLSFKGLHTPAAIQDYLARALAFPDYYGKNLDALHDMLASWDLPVTLVLRLPAAPQGEAAAYLPRLERVFCDAAEENPRLRVLVR